MATPPFLPDETKPGASSLISLYPAVAHTFRDVIESWLLVEHNTTGTHKQVTLDDISEPTIAATLVGLWHESGVLKTRFAGGTVYNVVTSNTGLLLAGGTMTGDLVLAGAPDADLKAATKKYVDDADVLKAPLASPALTGNPTAPTQSAGNNSTRIATTAFVQAADVIRRTAIATTSGTAHGFTSIPAGTNRIVFMISKVSLSGSNRLLIQLGDSGGYETTSYDTSASSGQAANVHSTAGFIVNWVTGSGTAFSGVAILERIDGNEWVSNGNLVKDGGGSDTQISAGNKTLSAELDRIRIVTTGADTFDAGKVNIMTEA